MAFGVGEALWGMSDGVVPTWEGNVQTTWRDILPAAMLEAPKAETAARATLEVQNHKGSSLLLRVK